MESIGKRCFPLFNWMEFVARLMPWLWLHDPLALLGSAGETIATVQKPGVCTRNIGSLAVIPSDLEYLTQKEARHIIDQFESIPQSSDSLLFWTGVPRKWAQQWADEHGMLTLTSAMGPLMDITDQRCLIHEKGPRRWSRYIKGASGIFARFACGNGIVRLLTLPPSRSEFLRPVSSYRTIEEPVLKGSLGCCSAAQINVVHLLEECKDLEYQIWPEDHTSECFGYEGASDFKFRLAPWILKEHNKMVRLTVSPAREPAVVSSRSDAASQALSVLPTRRTKRRSKRKKSHQALQECGTQHGSNQTKKSPRKTNARKVEACENHGNQQPQGSYQLQKNAQRQSKPTTCDAAPSRESKKSRKKAPSQTRELQGKKQRALDSKSGNHSSSVKQKRCLAREA